MVGALFSLLVFAAMLSIGGEIIMRVRLSLREASGEKLVWWRRGGDAVSAAYKKYFLTAAFRPIGVSFSGWLWYPLVAFSRPVCGSHTTPRTATIPSPVRYNESPYAPPPTVDCPS